MATFSPRKAHGLQSMGFGVAVLALLALGEPAAIAAPLAARVSADAIAYVATPDVAELERHWSSTEFARLWQSDGFSDFRGAFRQATRLSASTDVSLLGINWSQLASVASGEACWALVPVGDEVGFVVLVDVSQNAVAAEKLVINLRKQAPSRTYFLADGVLGVTNRSELTQPPAMNLSSSMAFAAIAKRTLFASAQIVWFLDPWELRPIIFDSKTWRQLGENGFKVIQAAGGAMTFASSEHDLEHHWCVYAPGERMQAARLLDFSPLTDWTLPAWIPADVDSVLSIQWNLVGALPGYGALFDSAYAEGEEGTFDAVLEDIKLEPQGPEVDIPTMLKLQVGPVMVVTKTLADGSTAAVYAVKVKDEKTVAGALERMFAPDEGVDQRQVGKVTMWVFKDAKADRDAGPAMGPDLAGYALAAAGGYLYVATSAPVLERILAEAPGPKLIDDATFRRLDADAKGRRPENAVGWRVSPVAAGLHSLYEGLRASGGVDLGRLLGDPENIEHRLDFKKLPAGEILPKFVAPGFGFVNQTEEGWLLQGFVEKGAE